MKVNDILNIIENLADLSFQESYDNAGLLLGDRNAEIQSVLLCLDCTEAVVQEAVDKGCGLILAHHPLIFKGMKQLTGSTDQERAVIKAIRNNIAVYAAHTNLDNVLYKGVNSKFAEKLELNSLQVLKPSNGNLVKIIVYCPESALETVRETMFNSGAGHIGLYSECSFTMKGQGSFKPGTEANPVLGKRGEREYVDEIRLEAIAPRHLSNTILKEIKAVHPYEEVAYEIIPLNNSNQDIGSGIIGTLQKPMMANEFLDFLKLKLNLKQIRHTLTKNTISRVALCGGSGSFLLGHAIKSGADAYVTADVKYHDFFEAPDNLMFCDIGHYESEISTLELFNEVIQEKFPTFAVRFCETITNPIHYH